MLRVFNMQQFPANVPEFCMYLFSRSIQIQYLQTIHIRFSYVCMKARKLHNTALFINDDLMEYL